MTHSPLCSELPADGASRGRVVFPIFDHDDRVVAFGGRVLPTSISDGAIKPKAKYFNSPTSVGK